MRLFLLAFLLASPAFAQPSRIAVVPAPSTTWTTWQDEVARLRIGFYCAAQATAQYPEPLWFRVDNLFSDGRRAWSVNPLHPDLVEFQFEWESDHSDGYRTNYGSMSYTSHPDAFVKENSRGEKYVTSYVTIPPTVGGKDPLEVAKDAARKGIPMKWTLSHPGGWATFYIGVDWDSIMGSCGRTDFVGGGDGSLSQAQISNVRFHIQQASEALGMEQVP